MKMKAVCEATGLTDRTVRYYIEEGLISPAYTENHLGRKTLDFSETNINELHDIAVLRKFGFSISEIREMLSRPEDILRIVNELRERKQSHIDLELELLHALSRLDTEHSYTVPELADRLSAPVVDSPLPPEDLSASSVLLRACGVSLLVILVLITLFVGLLYAIFELTPIEYTETTDIADYGTYTGTCADEFTQAYVDSFFPAEISDSFTDISYSYKAMHFDTYAFEAYLEFTIEDTNAFNNYIDSIASADKWQTFPFDEDFMEYSIENGLYISVREPEEFERLHNHPIEQARIRKILYAPETQTIIYVAMGVYDGGGVATDYLCVFFERFGIDPVEYAQTTDAPFQYGPYDTSISISS